MNILLNKLQIVKILVNLDSLLNQFQNQSWLVHLNLDRIHLYLDLGYLNQIIRGFKPQWFHQELEFQILKLALV